MTYAISNAGNVAKVDKPKVLINDKLSLAAWSFPDPVRQYPVPLAPGMESFFIFGEQHMLALVAWLRALRWPVVVPPNCPGITWLELYCDFVINTGQVMPTRLGFHETVGVFQRTCGPILLKVNNLSEILRLFKNSVQAVSFLLNEEVMPLKPVVSKCKSLMCFISARPQAGLASRPLLVSPERSMQAVFDFHEQGRNEAGKWAKLAAQIKLDTSTPSLSFPKVEDSSYESRISTWLKKRNLNVLVRAKNR